MERCVLYTHIVSTLAFRFHCNTSAHTHPSSKAVGNDKSTQNHTCPSKPEEIIANSACISHSQFTMAGKIIIFGTLLSAKFHSLYGFIFKFLLLLFFFFFPQGNKEEKMKNPETLCFYKHSSISGACKFFYLWLFGSHDRCAECYKKATLERRINTPLSSIPNCLCPTASTTARNKWMGIQQGWGEIVQHCFMPRRSETFSCRFCQTVRAQFI